MDRYELRPDLSGVVFSSGANYPIAEALAELLGKHFPIVPYRSFFDREGETILTTFLRKLLTIDVAVLVLGADDVQLQTLVDGSSREIRVPRDNVVFELGATMARLGTKKVFMLVPSELNVRVPSYMRHSKLFSYDPAPAMPWEEALQPIANEIIAQLSNLGEDLFHSDLPALGLVQSYFYNFVNPVHEKLDEEQSIRFEDDSAHPWKKESGYTLTIVVPNHLMNRKQVDEYCKQTLHTSNVHVRIRDGRDISVYALPRTGANSPLHMIDIPTTLLTSDEVITRVDDFWRTQDETRQLEANVEFRQQLARREIATFYRRMTAILSEKGITTSTIELNSIRVIRMEELDSYLPTLGD
ncbi:hypothetical protein HNR46_001766 [Haloferula luteola]|uniref:CD-NTase-associated protein 12 n=1 Tax=Haloferula luteola TaxID=595692 RepID=A0A840VCJ9_9BACT|nr:STING domain-containing protein [Haloferula luteola]MBB5351529.1 hypothetical protein [Haloferula luteola]